MAESKEQTVREQLAEALKGLVIGFTALGQAVEKESGPPPADFYQRLDKAHLAFVRHCAEPEEK